METIRFVANVELQAAAEGKAPRVSILAYTGGIMDVPGFGPVLINLAGLKMAPTIPLLADHLTDLRGVVGSGTPRATQSTLSVDGTLSTATENGKAVLQLARDGVPLQGSVGVEPGEIQRVRQGEKVTANGRTHTAGPRGLAYIAGGTLREVSITPLGADGSTSVTVSATKGATMIQNPTAPAEGPDAATAERERVQAIRASCRGEYREIEDEAIRDGWDIGRTNTAVLAALRASRGRAPSPAGGGSIAGNPRDVLTAACMLMGGGGEIVAKTLPDGQRLANTIAPPSGWPELCALALRLEGHPVPTGRTELIRAGFSTTSLPNALGSSVEKLLLPYFLDLSANWRSVARIVNAKSFRPGKAVRLAAGSKLEKIGPAGEIKHGALSEDAFDYSVATYAKMFDVTRQDIVNDDLGILNELPAVLGGEAARSVSDRVFSVLTANPGSFFGAGHGNEINEPLATAALSHAVRILRTRTDADGRVIGLVPTTLLVPAALESIAQSILSSLFLFRDQTIDSQATANPFAKLNLTLAVEPRLDATSTDDWYLFAQAQNGVILVAFLDGRDTPIVEPTVPEGDVLGAGIRCYLDFEVSLGEYRAAVMSDLAPYT